MPRKKTAADYGPVLIVDRCQESLDRLAQELAPAGLGAIDTTRDFEQACTLVTQGYRTLIMDVRGDNLPACVKLQTAATSVPRRLAVALMSDDPDAGLAVFQLRSEGADFYLDKPFTCEEFMQKIPNAFDELALTKRAARFFYGRYGLKQAQLMLRIKMSKIALERTGGSLRASAQLLDIDRRYMARLARKHGHKPPPAASTASPADSEAKPTASEPTKVSKPAKASEAAKVSEPAKPKRTAKRKKKPAAKARKKAATKATTEPAAETEP